MSSSTPSSAVFSQAVQSIIKTKSAELYKKHESYKSKTVALISQPQTPPYSDLVDRAHTITDLKLPFADANELYNITNFLIHAKFDPYATEAQLSKYIDRLTSLVNQQDSRLLYAKIYSAILTDHLQHENSSIAEITTPEESSLDDSYEVLEHTRLAQLRQKFEEVVFANPAIDNQDLTQYLNSLFSTDKLRHTLKRTQDGLRSAAKDIWIRVSPFNCGNLDSIMTALIRSSMLKNEKKALLKSFQRDSLLMEEICDVLNMSWSDLINWSWTHNGDGLEVEPRRQLNGKYRVIADEDILDAIFLHYIGVRHCESVKGPLTTSLRGVLLPAFAEDKFGVPEYDIDRRRFYLDMDLTSKVSTNLQEKLNTTYAEEFFLSHLPASLKDDIDYDDDEEGSDSQKSMVDLRQQLLRHIAAEVQMRSKTSRDIAVVQTDIKWFGTSMPHSTIYAVLRFLGLPERWLEFFKTYLETPLNLNQAGRDGKLRKRTCGIPMAHSLEKFIGEMVLLCMDIAVKHEADVLLYRMHDDIFFYGTVAQCEKAWATLEKFIKLAGLELNLSKTGSVCISETPVQTSLPHGNIHFNFLRLYSDGSWKVDRKILNPHIKQLRKQLGECKDILSFIRTYNSCIGRFFSHTFGQPARCFGRDHVDEVLKVHLDMQKELFGDHGIQGVLKAKLKQLAQEQHLNIEPSDAFIFTSVAFGGLGVVNPFIPLLHKRDNFLSPDEIMDQFFEEERSQYKRAKDAFERDRGSKRAARYDRCFNHYDPFRPNPPPMTEFFTFEEYTKHREVFSKEWRELYEVLTAQPYLHNVKLSDKVKQSLNGMSFGVRVDDLSEVEKYTIQLYADELFEEFGTLQILDRSLVPIGVVKALLEAKVTWQMVL